MKYILFFTSCIFILLQGCTKPSNSDTTHFLSTGIPIISSLTTIPDTVDNYIMVWSTQYLNVRPSDASTSFSSSVSAFFMNQNAGALTAAGKICTLNAHNSYLYSYNDSNKKADGIAMLGANLTVSTSGTTSVPAISKTMYMPKKLFTGIFQKNTYDGTTTNPISFTWQTDSTNFNQVMIQVDKLMTSTSTTVGAYSTTYVVADNGSYTLPNTFCTNWPVGTMFNITLGRATETIHTAPNGRKTYIYGIVTAQTGQMKYK